MSTPALSFAVVAPLLGTFRSTTDRCQYTLSWQQNTLWQARTRPGQSEEEPYPVAPAQVKRLVDYKLFVREEAADSIL